MTFFRKKKSLRDARDACRKRHGAWRSKVTAYYTGVCGKLKRRDRKRVRALLGLDAYSGRIRASDMAATLHFGLTCADVVHSQWLAVRDARWFHITLLADEFQLSERSPALAFKRLKGKVYKEIQKLGLDALAWIDVHPLPNYPQNGAGGTFLVHVHAVAYTTANFDLEEARMTLKRSRSWSCKFGAEPTKILEVTKEMGSPAWWAAYAAKPPHDAKRIVVAADGSAKLHSTTKGYRPQLAMRLIEGLSQLDLMEMVFSVGEAKFLREDIRKAMLRWHRKRWPDKKPVKEFDDHKLFKRLWAATRVKSYNRWRIVGL